jgi:hypothetical protein
VEVGLRVDLGKVLGFFRKKYLREESGTRVDFVKYRGIFFCKMNEARPIRAVRAPDPTVGNGRDVATPSG